MQARARADRQGWASVIVKQPLDPKGSNENAASSGTGQDHWDAEALLAAIRSAGRYVRAVDAQTQAQAERLRELIAPVREHLRAAIARAEEAEAREQQTRLWAQAAIAAAEERARVATERADVAEAWLARIAEAIRAEFPDLARPEPVEGQEAA